MNVVWELFTAFLKIGFLSIGGGYAVIPMSQEQVVEKNSWISEKMFTDIITISQMTPGPLAVNTSTFVGLQVGGTVGALAATIGCNHWLHLVRGCYFTGFLPFFQSHRQSDYVTEVLNGMKSASLGLIISAAFTIIRLALYGSGKPGPDFLSLNWTALVLFLTMLFILRKWKLNPVLVMLISGMAGFLCYQ